MILVFVILVGIIAALNYIPRWVNVQSRWLKNTILFALVTSTALFLALTVLAFNGYRIKGFYNFSIITWCFIGSTIAFFTLFKNSKKKIAAVCLLAPTIVLGFWMLVSGQLVYARNMDATHKIFISSDGFLACGETFVIAKTKFRIFDKEVFRDGNLCITGTYSIETVKFDDQNAEFLIYHHGQNNDDGPYRYTVDLSRIEH